MNRYRYIYAAVVVVTLVLIFLFQNRFLLVMGVLELILPLVLYVMIRMETAHMTYSVSVPRGCVAGESCEIVFNISKRLPFVATDGISLRVEFLNSLCDRKTTQDIYISGENLKKGYNVTFNTYMCGEERIICRDAVCYDIFGVCSVHIQPFEEQQLVVIPRQTMVRVLEKENLSGANDGEQTDPGRKGHDATEVFDIRDYQSGDDVRAVHWKLSGKLDRMLVKEAGYSTHYDTIVLFDAGEGDADRTWSDEVLAGVMDFASTFSRRLVEMQRPHYVGLYLGEKFTVGEIDSMDSLVKLIHQNMGVSLQKKTGQALAYFYADNMQDKFSRIIYIVNGTFPEQLYKIAGVCPVTAICITDDKEDIVTIKKGISTMIEIPVDRLYDHEQYIYV